MASGPLPYCSRARRWVGQYCSAHHLCSSLPHADQCAAARLLDACWCRFRWPRGCRGIRVLVAGDSRMVAPMSRDSLTTYLNDHLAGARAALEMLDHLIDLQQGKPREGRLA